MSLLDRLYPPQLAVPRVTGRFEVADTCNPLWRDSERGRRITVPRNPILAPSSKIFTIGSCFAMEIRNALSARGFAVFPKYRDIAIDSQRQQVSKLPEHEDIPFYDSFTILQEFWQAFDNHHFALDDFIRHTPRWWRPETWQDPHRKSVRAVDEASILDISAKIDACIADGIAQADVYIITLGLIETWRNPRTGAHHCIPPYDHGRMGADSEFHLSTYQENLDNLRRICTLIGLHYPERTIVLTVSPVGLGRTETTGDVVTATVEAKSILRAVCAAICREFGNVSYWPSYELATREDIFKADGRHVRPDAVATIVDAFIEAHT